MQEFAICFKKELHLINEAITNSTVLLGDLNLNENKCYAVDNS
jgi:hypothetical protein